MKRREFINTALIGGMALQFPHFWVKKSAAENSQFKITLLQTNDTHSRIDPFPMDGGRNQGMGGIARRAALIKKIKHSNPNTLLVDGGDVLQGTPYFNMYKGKIEYKTMTQCGYDATTLGNHEFDNGVILLNTALHHAKFDILNCNYDFGETPLAKSIRTFSVKQVGPIKVGITGVGIDFVDLVAAKNHEGIQYQDPYKPLGAVVKYLRGQMGCSLVIVLSHLGYKSGEGKPNDPEMAFKVNGIDWIVGGHTHTFMKTPELVISKRKHKTRILQVGFAGILLGQSDFIFEGKNLVAVNSHSHRIDAAFDRELIPARLTA